MKANLPNTTDAPEFRFLSDNPNAVGLYAPLQMVRTIDTAGVHSWRAPKAETTLRDVDEWMEAQGGQMEWLSVTRYNGGYRHTVTIG